MKTFNIWSLALICTLYGAGISANDLGAILAAATITSKALPGQSIHLPADHGAHPDYRPSGGISPAT